MQAVGAVCDRARSIIHTMPDGRIVRGRPISRWDRAYSRHEHALNLAGKQINCAANCRSHTRWIRETLSCNLKRGTVIGRRTNVGKTQRDIGGITVCDQLHGNKSLVVVWRNDDIKFARVSAVVQTIGRVWSGNTNAPGRTGANGGFQHIHVFASKHAAFAGMGIDCGHSDL